MLEEKDFREAREQEKYVRIVKVIKEATGIATYGGKAERSIIR